MAEEITIDGSFTKEETYEALIPQIQALIAPEDDLIANLANISAVLKEQFNFWWVGFYWLKNNELVLGPFQGPLACTRIAIGKGVCGKAFQQRESILVPNVNQFEGHIACSSTTQSEIVVPILVKGQCVGVLDVDSEFLNHFDLTDQHFLEVIAQLISSKL